MWSGLLSILSKFDENGWKGRFTEKEWSIGNGGYDQYFEIYYKEQPVLDCIGGKITAWGLEEDVLNKLCKKVIKRFPYLTKE